MGLGIVSLCLYPVRTYTSTEYMEDHLQENQISKAVCRHVCEYASGVLLYYIQILRDTDLTAADYGNTQLRHP